MQRDPGIFQAIDISEHRVAKEPRVKRANLGGIDGRQNFFLHAHDVNRVLDSHHLFAGVTQQPARAIGLLLDGDRLALISESSHVFYKGIVGDKLVPAGIVAGHTSTTGTERGEGRSMRT